MHLVGFITKKLESLDAIDISCLIKPLSLIELLNCDKTLDALYAIDNWCFIE
jgi:hypothetical protein